MSKLYIFGIGGTGCRVVRALTMLLASGVECKANTIVPVIIDRDLSNGDLTRTKALIDNYISVSKIAPKQNKDNRNKFFNTEIKLLKGGLCLQLKDNTQVFSEFIQRSTMTKNNKALIDVLFSKDALAMDMTAGFQGVPNIGSVVLNQFDDSEVFSSFAQDFQNGDKIFMVSSIFGGTGASGFPLLLKTFNATNPDITNWSNVNTAQKGAITVLPYFNVEKTEDPDSRVDSDTFIDKAKAALSYYKTLDKQIDYLYYIADNQQKTYPHNKGGKEQKNNAHFIELASAMAILDFVNLGSDETRNNEGVIVETKYKEFGIKPHKTTNADGVSVINSGVEISFADLADETKAIIRNHLTQLFLFRKYIKEVYGKENRKQPWSKNYPWKKDWDYDDTFIRQEGSPIKKLIEFLDDYFMWLQEMADQSRKFTPFKFEISESDSFEFVTDVPLTKKGSLRYKNWAWFDNELNKQNPKVSKSLTHSSAFIELFFRTTEQFVKQIIKN